MVKVPYWLKKGYLLSTTLNRGEKSPTLLWVDAITRGRLENRGITWWSRGVS